MKSIDFSYYAVVRQWVQWSGGESAVGAAGGRDTIKGSGVSDLHGWRLAMKTESYGMNNRS